MAETQGRVERDFVLAPNEFVFIQDQTKGQISVYVGPHKSTLAPTDTPIIYDSNSRKFQAAGDLQRAIQQFPAADEGYYLVLENPAEDEKRPHPELGTSTGLARLKSGRKINIPGPQTFPLWPGQVAKVVEGHRLRTNQYLIVRVYNDEEAKANQTLAVIRPADSTPPVAPVGPKTDGGAGDQTQTQIEMQNEGATPQAPPPTEKKELSKVLTMGQLMVIRGNEVSFYMPPTGIEVVPDDSGKHVREAVTLERLEYCVLLSEDGNKRYLRGPAVVFPEPTEKFITATDGNRKFRAIELNDDMGLYIKVTADYEEGGHAFHAGDELFITGKEQRLYYPRAEHSIIKYGDREIHYGIAIHEGEARYVLDKQTGNPELVKGPKIFLPDPRRQVIVLRVLTDDEVNLWYPNNTKAQEHNKNLREMQKQYGDMVKEESLRMLSNVPGRRATRSVSSESAVQAFSGDQFDRGTNYTPPRTITLDNKFEGAVSLNIWNGYAVLVVDKNGNQRVEVGPKTVLLEYDETLQVLQLSTGKPKTTDKLERTVYLRVSFNQVSDIIDVVTEDMVKAEIKLSYRVNFVGDNPAKWFSVENYVKFMSDHARSLLRNAAKHHTIEELNARYIDIVSDTILGTTPDQDRRVGRLFEENNVLIYDIEVSSLTIGDAAIGKLLGDMQQAAVRETLQVASKERELEATRRVEIINRQITGEKEETLEHLHENEKAKLNRQKEVEEEKFKVQAEEERAKNATNAARLARDLAEANQRIDVEKRSQGLQIELIDAETKAVVEKAGAIKSDLIAALQAFGDQKIGADLAKALSPLAILGGQSVADVINTMLKDTAVGEIAKNALAAANPAAASSRAATSGSSSGDRPVR